MPAGDSEAGLPPVPVAGVKRRRTPVSRTQPGSPTAWADAAVADDARHKAPRALDARAAAAFPGLAAALARGSNAAVAADLASREAALASREAALVAREAALGGGRPPPAREPPTRTYCPTAAEAGRLTTAAGGGSEGAMLLPLPRPVAVKAALSAPPASPSPAGSGLAPAAAAAARSSGDDDGTTSTRGPLPPPPPLVLGPAAAAPRLPTAAPPSQFRPVLAVHSTPVSPVQGPLPPPDEAPAPALGPPHPAPGELAKKLDYKSCDHILCLTKEMARDLLPPVPAAWGGGPCQLAVEVVDAARGVWPMTYRCVPSRYSYELRAGWKLYAAAWGVGVGDVVFLAALPPGRGPRGEGVPRLALRLERAPRAAAGGRSGRPAAAAPPRLGASLLAAVARAAEAERGDAAPAAQ